MTMHFRSRPAAMILLLLGAAVAAGEPADLDRAQDLFKASRFREAIPVYEQVVPTLEGKAKAEAQFRLAYAMMRTYKGGPAIDAFKKLLEMEEVGPERRGSICYRIGYLYALDRQFETAIEWYLKIPDIEGADPTNVATGYLFAGHSCRKLEQFDRALEMYAKAAAVEDAHFVTRQTALIGIGTQHQDDERYAEAAEAFRRAVKLGPRHHYGHVAANRLLECEVAQSGSDAFYIDPYVPRIGASMADVTWVSRHDAPAGTVRVTAQGHEPIVIEAGRTDFHGHETAFRQRAALTGLAPGTRYAYTVACGGEQRTGTFQTGPADAEPVRFAVIGDTQGGHAVHAEVAANMADFDPQLVIHVGDCVERGDRWDEWKVQMFDPGRSYMDKAPVLVARGNHDGGSFFRIFFNRAEHLFEDFRYGDVHVFVMDSYSSTGGSRRTAQLAWLEEGLAASDARWKVVALHHPMLHAPATEPLFGEDDFLRIAAEAEVDLVVNGHYHVYQRLLPIKLPGKKPLLNITSGGGGGNMGSRTMSPLIVADSMDHHHLRFTVDGGRLEMRALLRDGTEIDRLVLEKSAAGYQGAIMDRAVPLEQAQAARLFYHYLTHPNVRRDELAAVVEGEAVAGEPVTLHLKRHLLDPDEIPAGAKLVIRPVAGDPWTLEEQVIDLATEPWTFAVTAPGELTVADGNVRPALGMQILLRADGFDFEPEPVRVLVEME